MYSLPRSAQERMRVPVLPTLFVVVAFGCGEPVLGGEPGEHVEPQRRGPQQQIAPNSQDSAASDSAVSDEHPTLPPAYDAAGAGGEHVHAAASDAGTTSPAHDNEGADSDLGDRDGASSDGSTRAWDQCLDSDASTYEHDSPRACDSTWRAIRTSIFEANGCTAAVCHSASAQQGQLDLASDVSYANLINRPASASLTKPMNRVTPGEQALSFLYLKVAAGIDGTHLPAGGGAQMPIGRAPLTSDQLTALKLWIRAGAPETGVVAGTQDVLDCTQPASADPNKAPRPPVPSADKGFQHAAGPWTVKARSEGEVCLATYYDLTDSAPEWAKLPCTIGGSAQTCVGVNERMLSQDAQSHHSAISVYAGTIAADEPSWGPWRCAGGERPDQSCAPTNGDAQCGSRGVCQAAPRAMVTCGGFGPANKESSSVPAGGAQSPVNSEAYPDGVYSKLPLKGMILWNSHGFNLTSKDTTVEQYNTFWFAAPEERGYELQGVLTAGESTPNADLLINVPPYQKREYCSLYTLPRHARAVSLSSHVHKRGVRWRTWLPPHATSCPVGGCMPDEAEPIQQSRYYNDPVTTLFDPPRELDQAEAEARTIKFCSVFDNGKDDPALLKRKSQLPAGSSCQGPLYCAGGGHAGQSCSSDAECGTGSCDACAVTWGVTTEDEMFFLAVSYYIVPPGT
jgi:hypothetical protein